MLTGLPRVKNKDQGIYEVGDVDSSIDVLWFRIRRTVEAIKRFFGAPPTRQGPNPGGPSIAKNGESLGRAA